MSKTITAGELLDLLCQRKGATFVVAVTKTDAKLKKRGNPFGQVWKRATVNLLLNFHYDAGVLRRLEKEGKSPDDFRKGDSWHEAITWPDGSLTPFCRHKENGTIYLRACVQKRVGDVEYLTEGGEALTKEQVEPFLPARNDYANQGLDEPLVFATYKLDSVKEISVDGETYLIGD
jgi:hypothetical protein